jgi:hypothetical protein
MDTSPPCPAEASDMNQRRPELEVTDQQTAEELARISYEPLLPAEKKLIVGSLLLGFVLLGVLLWVSATYFPTPGW